jgi:hypothetical protein
VPEVELRGGTLEYRDVGAGPVVVLIETADSCTLIPEDQPALLAQHLREFISGSTPGHNSRAGPLRRNE